VFGVCLSINLLVAGIQQFLNKDFLSDGSGTAIIAQRVPGLIEDSGAFTTLFAFITLGILWIAFSKKVSKTLTVSLTFISLLFFAFGILACGRTYILSVIIGMSVLAGIRLIKNRSIAVFAITTLILAATWSIFYYLSQNVQRYTLQNLSRWKFEDFFSIQGWEQSIDYQRIKSLLAMWENIKSEFPFGSGLGSFHSYCGNLVKKFQWPNVFVDWPASFYLQMVSELGLAGIFVLLSLALLYVNALRKQRSDYFHLFILGSFFAILLAWMIGIHYIFPSIALCLGFMFAYLLSETEGTWKKSLHTFVSLACLSLILSIAVAYVKAPSTATEFHWEQRGSPQEPNVLREVYSEREGNRYTPGSEILIDQKSLFLVSKNPLKEKNLTLTFKIFDNVKGQLTSYTVPTQEDTWKEWTWPEAIYEECKGPTLEHFCYAKLELKSETHKKTKFGILISKK
jgi:hypothetical protein